MKTIYNIITLLLTTVASFTNTSTKHLGIDADSLYHHSILSPPRNDFIIGHQKPLTVKPLCVAIFTYFNLYGIYTGTLFYVYTSHHHIILSPPRTDFIIESIEVRNNLFILVKEYSKIYSKR